MTSIYVVTVVKPLPDGRRRKRTWGWYQDFASAARDVLANATDMFELNYYDHAVIERHEEGILAEVETMAWYLADYSKFAKSPDRNPEVKKILVPEWAQNIISWGLG